MYMMVAIMTLDRGFCKHERASIYTGDYLDFRPLLYTFTLTRGF